MKHAASGYRVGLHRRAAAVIFAKSLYLVSSTVIVGAIVLGIRGTTFDRFASQVTAVSGIVIVVLFAVLQISSLVRKGGTIAHRLAGYRIVDVQTQQRIGLVRAIIRQTTLFAISVATLGIFAIINIIVMLRDDRGRGLHDRLARTVAVWPHDLSEPQAVDYT